MPPQDGGIGATVLAPDRDETGGTVVPGTMQTRTASVRPQRPWNRPVLFLTNSGAVRFRDTASPAGYGPPGAGRGRPDRPNNSRLHALYRTLPAGLGHPPLSRAALAA